MVDRWRFVESMSASPVVRLDLNDGAVFEVADADLTPPELRDQMVSSMLVDGDHISASAYSNRVVGLTVELVRATQDLAATQRQLLERELQRETNFLEYRPDGASQSVFFRTFRSSMGTPIRQPASDAYYVFSLQIKAEPFAYGLKETLSNVTLAANPASANGLEFTVTAANAKGDVETPLNLKFADASKFSPGSAAGIQMLIGTRRRGTVASMPYVFQCESMTQGTDTTVTANSALYSGAGSNNSTTTFATASLATRLTATVPATATKEARGQYRVLAKVRPTGAFTGQLQWNYQFASGTVSVSPAEGLTTYTATGASAAAVFIDLGILSLPASQDPATDGPSGTDLSVSAGSLKLQASRTSGAGSLVWDFIALVPADDTLCFVAWNDVFTSASEHGYIDGYTRRAYVGTDTTVAGYPTIAAPTGYPMITPNQDNRVCVVPAVGRALDGTSAYTLTTTHTVTPYYWPRYIDVRPSAT